MLRASQPTGSLKTRNTIPFPNLSTAHTSLGLPGFAQGSTFADILIKRNSTLSSQTCARGSVPSALRSSESSTHAYQFPKTQRLQVTPFQNVCISIIKGLPYLEFDLYDYGIKWYSQPLQEETTTLANTQQSPVLYKGFEVMSLQAPIHAAVVV